MEAYMKKVLDKYDAIRGSTYAKEDSPFWDVVVITTADDEQRLANTLQIQTKLERGDIPRFCDYVVTSDPPACKCGNGGATLSALSQLHEKYSEKLYSLKVLLMHSGGQSKRLPIASVSGKAFTLLPFGDPLYQMIDLQLAMFLPFVEQMKPGVLVTSSDVILSYDLDGFEDNISFSGFTAFGHQATVDVGTRHGVYVIDGTIDTTNKVESLKCKRVLQKNTREKIIESGAVIEVALPSGGRIHDLDMKGDPHGLDMKGDTHGLDMKGDTHGLDMKGDTHGLDMKGDIHSLDMKGDTLSLDMKGDTHGLDMKGDTHGLDMKGDTRSLDMKGDTRGLDMKADIHGLDMKGDAHGLDMKADIHGLDMKADTHGLDMKSDTHDLDIKGDLVYTDSVFYFDHSITRVFLDFYDCIKPMTCEIDAYGDFLQALGSAATDDYIHNSVNITTMVPDVVEIRRKLYGLLKGRELTLLALNRSSFNHIGTTREYLYHLCDNERLSKEFNFQRRAFSVSTSANENTNTSEGTLIHCKVDVSCEIRRGSVVEFCHFERSVIINPHSIISNCQLLNSELSETKVASSSLVELPSNIILYTVPVLYDGHISYVTMFFSIDDDLKLVKPHSQLQFMHNDIKHYECVNGCQRGQVIPEDWSPCGLWECRLFPVCRTMSESFLLSAALLSGSHKNTAGVVHLAEYTTMSMADVLKNKHLESMLAYRARLHAVISQNV